MAWAFVGASGADLDSLSFPLHQPLSACSLLQSQISKVVESALMNNGLFPSVRGSVS